MVFFFFNFFLKESKCLTIYSAIYWYSDRHRNWNLVRIRHHLLLLHHHHHLLGLYYFRSFSLVFPIISVTNLDYMQFWQIVTSKAGSGINEWELIGKDKIVNGVWLIYIFFTMAFLFSNNQMPLLLATIYI